MSLAALLTRTAEVTTRSQTGAADSHGNQAWVESGPTSYPAYLEQTTEQEITIDRDTQISDHLMVLGPEAVIDGDSSVTIDGQAFQVIGPPLKAYSPRGLHHLEVRLRSITG